MQISLPDDIKYIINTFEYSGYGAYVVGGCVRDSLLKKEPVDWDICTTALPEETIGCFRGHRIIETGLQHGTVTLIINDIHYEITTFRIDGLYSDNRRPDTVNYTDSLIEDLSRRDFTINSMAYNPKVGIVDYFDGLVDIKMKIIRCVGKAEDRFQEDALRIMRALRFASELGFSLDKNTVAAMVKKKHLLQKIAAERISDELNRFLVGENVSSVLLSHIPIITEVIPEFLETVGFDQNTPYHCYDVFTHIAKSIDFAPRDIIIRLALFLHDITKPQHYTEKDGIGHFRGHPQTGSDKAEGILSRLKYNNKIKKAVTELILYHDTEIIPERKLIKHWLNILGEVRFRQLLEVKRADALARTPEFAGKRLAVISEIESMTEIIIKQEQCFCLKDLSVSGKDLIAEGISEGKDIGNVLNHLLDVVISEELPNEIEPLLAESHRFILSSNK